MIKRITLTSMLVLFVFCTFAKSYKQDAIAYLKKNQTELKLSEQDIADLVVLEDVLDDYTNINRVWMQQSINGIVLKNGLISVHFKDGKVVNSTNSGVYDLKKQVSTTTPTLSAKDAVLKAAAHVGITNVGSLKQHGKAVKNEYVFEPAQGLSDIEIHAQLALSRDKNNKVFLTWIVQFHTLDEKHFWNIDVNALDGSFISKYDQILHCEFGQGNFLESQGHKHTHSGLKSYIGTPSVPVGSSDDVAQPTAGSYRVYPYTVESPVFGTRQLIANPDDAAASPFGWHDNNGVAGAEYTITRGNNVHAYADKDGNNAADANSSPDGTASLTFDYNLDFNTQLDTFNAAGTLTNSKAIVTQLFYMNNIMHDIFFKYGFTESSRNFQQKNYTNVAGGTDYVWAEAHDGAGTNNANFATSPDGQNSAFSRSRMQMFMWDGAPPVTLTYNAPASIAGVIDSIGTQSGWGPCNFNVTGAVANATSATAPPTFVCGSVNNPTDIAGKIALIDRGNCDFSAKVFNAQQAGAIGVIVINRQSAGDSLLQMAAGTNAAGVTIPAVIVKYTDGQKLRNNLGTANVTLFRQSSTNCLELDGSLDNGIVSHEYGHGISTRLTGFSSGTGGTQLCLSNEEQAGEGWSDFFALVLSKKPADNKNTARGIGNYAFGEDANGTGIRRFPYSYDMSINPLTYDDVADDPEVHAIGEVWTSAIWDMYWNLVDKYGYSTDLYNGTAGNNRAIKLVVEGLKQQPCNPGFLDSRNAILKADSILYGYADRCEIWNAFARRGMGFSATQGTAGSATDQTAAFNLHPLCNTSPTATASFTASDTVVCAGGSLTFTNTSTASVGSPDSVRWTIPGGVPGTSTSTTTVSPVFSTAGTYIVSLIAYKSGNASVAATKSIRVKPLPTLTVTSPTICSGNTAQPVASGTSTGYSWTGGLASVANPTTPVLTTMTTYTVTGTRELCTATAVSTVTVNPSPTTSVGTPSAICSGSAASLTASGATSYTWSPNIGSTATVSTGVLTTTTTYTVTGTTGTCTKTATVTVTVTPLPNVTVNSPSVCSGGTASLTANGATSYTWSPNIGGTASVTTPALTTTTTYTVTGTASGCTKTAVSTVTVTAPPVVTINSVSPICSGSSASLTANGATSYSWSPNIGSTATVSTGILTTTTTYTVTGTTGCSATATVTVVVNPSPNVTINSVSPICSGSTASLQANNATSYTWSGGLSSVSNPTTPSLTTTTTYTVTGTASGCTGTATVTVTVNALPNVTVSSPSICAGTTASITASGASTYSWSPNIGGTATVTTPTLTTTTTYTVTGSNGTCTKSAVSTVTVTSSAPTVTITSNPVNGDVCIGDAITLTGNGANNYTWTSTLGTFSGGTYTFTPTADIFVNLSGTVTGCATPGTSSISINIRSKPTVGVNSTSICSGQTASLTANGASTYAWSPNIGSTASVTTPALTTTTNYTVTGTGAFGCTNTAVSTVTVGPVPATPTITQNSLSDTLYSSSIVAGATYEWYKSNVLTATTSTPYYVISSSGQYTVKVISLGCTSVVSANYNAIFTAIRTNSNSIQLFEVYPNPTDGRLVMNLNLTKSASVQIHIYTPEGKEMYMKAFTSTRNVNEELNLHDFAKGIYIIKLKVDDETFYHKVVKQ